MADLTIAEIKGVMHDALAPIHQSVSDVNTQLTRMNGNVQGLMEWRREQQAMNKEVAACITKYEARISVLEERSHAREKDTDEIEEGQRRQDERQERHTFWTFEHIVEIIIMLAAVAAAVGTRLP